MSLKQAVDFRNRLKRGEVVFGTFCKTTSPEMIECIGYSGFDFCIIDQEHGPVGMETLQNLTRAAELSGVCPIVRSASIDELGIAHPLDAGVAGVQVPQINSLDQALRVVRYSRFYPQGSRGVCRFVRAAQFSNLQRDKYFLESNESLVILQLEAMAMDSYEEIARLPTIDVFFIGPYDISQAVGKTGQIESPEVQTVVRSIISLVKKYNKAVGIFCDTPNQVEHWVNCGVQYIAYSVDLGLFLEKCKTMVQQLKSLRLSR